MLTERYSKDLIAGAAARSEARSPFPPAADRAAWEGLLRHPLNRLRKERVLAEAEALRGKAPAALPASGFIDFMRSGDRRTYETAYFSRRRSLALRVLSECF